MVRVKIFEASEWRAHWRGVAALTEGMTKEDLRFAHTLEGMDAAYRVGDSVACVLFMRLKRKLEKGVRTSVEDVERWAARRRGN